MKNKLQIPFQHNSCLSLTCVLAWRLISDAEIVPQRFNRSFRLYFSMEMFLLTWKYALTLIVILDIYMFEKCRQATERTLLKPFTQQHFLPDGVPHTLSFISLSLSKDRLWHNISSYTMLLLNSRFWLVKSCYQWHTGNIQDLVRISRPTDQLFPLPVVCVGFFCLFLTII